MLKLHEERNSLRTLFIFIAIAYIFSISVRFTFVETLGTAPQFRWNNELMINNNDGYYFAEGARDILAGSHDKNDNSPVEGAPAKLTAALSKIIPVSFETLILYMPAFLGSLIVIPIILIGRALNQTTMGFLAALLASIANSYYNRTMVGYYDTDMLNIVFPVLEMYSLILALTHQRNRYLIPISISIALYQWWYPQAYALDTALFGMIVGYTLLFDRKNLYLYKISLFILIGILAIAFIAKIGLALILFALFHFQRELSQKLFWVLFAAVVALYFSTGGVEPILHFIQGYFFNGEGKNTVSTLNFYNVMSTVREAGQIPFNVFAERISGHTITFVLAVVGYILALIAYRPLLITLPLVGLGFIAMSAGLRFTIYAVPPMAIGIAFLILYTTQFIQKPFLKYLSIATFMFAVLSPNYAHVRAYITPPVLSNHEVVALNELNKMASGKDYVVGWWDFGFPIRYYANVKTWADGAQHSGGQNYPISFVLTSSDPLSVAHMLRLNTEYMEKNFRDQNSSFSSVFEYMMNEEGFKDPNDFLNAIALPEYKTPPKTRDVYLYLPLRMMEIFPTVALFSNLDLKTGKSAPQPFFYASQNIQDTGKTLELGQGVSIDKATSTLKIGSQNVPVKVFYQVGYDQNQRIKINRQTFASEGLNVIFMASYNQFLVLDDYYFNSTYIQMFVLENYDKNLFQPVILSPLTKIYKLKI
ncbi:Oligosaccharyl transferase STT3 subunit [Sulfuricurvum kujiense DSM 16994]|uniref:Oligosaccharyl transferase STT3 subunit n=1 Tax=Sulfuricurvum kujiense (strain ATCC BAA-921 / DSM 16994 / JCM 11577 / YK-1) TaxID=709032 RepID=E4TYC8_SULKY|nr:STT3 domain-containing protein [Sulfuricurvum kujiense]ADR35073.1 Oligosaccharyl transferase STT3 subunit [Sulfuricurvum kujiense DSM 16994]